MTAQNPKTRHDTARARAGKLRSGGRRGLRLLGEIGGTTARFALQRPGERPSATATLVIAEHGGIEDAINKFIADSGGAVAAEAALAVAAPVAGDAVALTNGPWRFSARALKRRYGWRRLAIVNDFAALARALPLLRPRDLMKIGGGARAACAPMIAIGPGTGLGVAGLIPANGGYIAVAGEGGHATLGPADEREAAILGVLRRRFGHASAERAISGPGLVNLLAAICELEGEKMPRATPDGIARRALDGSSAFCAEAFAMFCAMLGTAAADAALAFGAAGGVFIGGGILRRHRDYFAVSPFRKRFESKGRYSNYLAAIPTYLIVREDAALLGLGATLGEPAKSRR